MARTSVFLVRGTVVEGSTDIWVSFLERFLGGLASTVVSVVVLTEEEAVKMINKGPGTKKSAIVFFTRGMFPRAALKEQNPDLLVMLLTADPNGLPTDQGVLIFDKGAFNPDLFEKAILA